MLNNEEKVTIIKPSKKVFETIENYKKLISEIVSDSKISLIGAFAVPMCGKKDIDILIETNNVKETQEKLKINNFTVGPIIKDEGFCRSKKYDIVCDVHIVTKNHDKIKKYFDLINNLKSDLKLLKKYEKLKKSLNNKTIKEYKENKNKFLKENNLI
jgi:GrpB-like predicted nucleotidyltransferase (UPF0157 family)